jgi:hypothetical protein
MDAESSRAKVLRCRDRADIIDGDGGMGKAEKKYAMMYSISLHETLDTSSSRCDVCSQMEGEP